MHSCQLDTFPDEVIDLISWYLDSTAFCRLWKCGSPSLIHRLQHVTSFTVANTGKGGYIWPKIAKLLSRMRVLVISSSSPVIDFRVRHLPPTVTSLSFSWPKCEESLLELDGTSIHKKALPLATILPELQVLALFGSYSLQTNFFQALPPTLRQLRLQNAGGMELSDFQLLPVGLELMELGDVSHTLYERCISFPSGLKTFIAKSGLWSDEQMKNLPNGLTSLQLDNSAFSDEAVALLPRSLLELRVPSCHWSDMALEALPSKILVLDLSRNPLLTSACFAKLPRSITWLNLESISSVLPSHLSDLPTSLKFSNFGPAFPTQAPSSGLLTHAISFAHTLFDRFYPQ